MNIRYKYYRLPNYKSHDYPTSGRPNIKHLQQYFRHKNWLGNHWKNMYHGIFKPTTKGGAVYCIVELEYTKIITVAYCSMSDTFSYDIGKQIAYNRAMRHLSLVEGAE